jgi:preprotein translocase subunit Sec63
MLLCCRSCLKGDKDREYYDVLQLTQKKPTNDEIKRAYKKISLSLHPDKLTQRGIEVTPEKRQEFLLVRITLQSLFPDVVSEALRFSYCIVCLGERSL